MSRDESNPEAPHTSPDRGTQDSVPPELAEALFQLGRVRPWAASEEGTLAMPVAQASEKSPNQPSRG